METNQKMKPEFTAEMHYEMLEDECSFFEIMIRKASVLMRKGIPKESACQQCGITMQQFKDNYSKIYPGNTLETLEDLIKIGIKR